jgi:hypothetical protein
MDDDRKPRPESGDDRPTPKDDREARLAAALRANLRRRKSAAARPDEDGR